MPTYRVSDKVSGAVLDLTGDTPPTDEDLDKIFAPFQQSARLKKDRSTPPLPVKSVMGSVGEAVGSALNVPAQQAAAIPADIATIVSGQESPFDWQNMKAATMQREMPITQKINEAASESPTAATVANISQGLASVAPYIATGNFPATAQRLMALGFSAQMVYGVKDLATQYGDEMGKPPEQRDQAKIAQLQAALIQTPLFTSLLAVGAKRGGLTGEKRPVTPVARPQAAAPTKTAPAVETPVQPQAAAPPAPLGGFPMADKLKARLDALKAQLPATATKIEPKQATSEPSYSPQDLARRNELTTEQNRLVAENKVGDKNGLTPEWTANQAAKDALKAKYQGGTPEQVEKPTTKSPEISSKLVVEPPPTAPVTEGGVGEVKPLASDRIAEVSADEMKDIAKQMGHDIGDNVLEGMWGVIGDKEFLFINKDLSPSRKAEVKAHELKHRDIQNAIDVGDSRFDAVKQIVKHVQENPEADPDLHNLVKALGKGYSTDAVAKELLADGWLDLDRAKSDLQDLKAGKHADPVHGGLIVRAMMEKRRGQKPTAPAPKAGEVKLGQPADKFGAVFGPNIGKEGYEKLQIASANFEPQELPSGDPTIRQTLQLKNGKLWLTTQKITKSLYKPQAITYLHVKPDGETVLGGSFAHPNHDQPTLAKLGKDTLAKYVSQWITEKQRTEKAAQVTPPLQLNQPTPSAVVGKGETTGKANKITMGSPGNQKVVKEFLDSLHDSRGLSEGEVTKSIQEVLGTKELPKGIKVVRDEGATWGAKITGRNEITVNASQISTPARVRAVIMEEGLHGVWDDPAVRQAWKPIRDSVTAAEMRAEYLKRKAQGLPTDAATIREEAAISKLLKLDADKGIAAKVYDVIRAAIKRVFGIDLPANNRQALKDAATAFLRREEKGQGTKGEAFAKGENTPEQNAANWIRNKLFNEGALDQDVEYALKKLPPSESSIIDIESALWKAGEKRNWKEILSDEGDTQTDFEGADPKDAFTWAKQHHGTTEDINEAGYVLPDGTMLDFSERRHGGGGQRSQDHRQIQYPGRPSEGYDAMRAFMKKGAMRTDTHGSIDLETSPTGSQIEKIRELGENNDGKLSIDVNDGNRKASIQAENTEKAIGLIRRFYRGEDLPEHQVRFATGDAEKAIDDSGAVRKNGIGIQKFFTDDVLKSLKGISGGVAQLARIAKTDFHNLFAPESASPNARATDALAAKYVQTREQIKQAFQKQTENQSKFWDALPEQTKLDFLQGMETGKVPDLGKYTEQAKVLAQQYRDRFDADFKNEKTLGIDINYRANYFPHLWKDVTAATKFFKQLRERMGGDRYAKAREINLISEGLKGGLELIDTNPETLALKRDFDSARIVTQQSFVNHLESVGLAEEVKAGGEYGGSTILTAPNGKRYALPPDVAAVVNNAFFQKSLWENKSIVGTGFRGLMNLKNLFIPVKLGLSLFHPVHIVGIDNAARLANIVEAVKDKNLSFSDAVKLAVKSQGNVFHPKGKQFVDAYNRYGWDKSMPTDMQQSVQYMIEGGFNPNREGVWKSRSGEGFRRAVSQGNYPGAAIRGIPAGLQMMQKPIFDMWIPRLRAAGFDVRARKLFRTRPELLDDATQRAIELRKIGKEIDNQYGEMNYSTLFWNRYCRDVGVGTSLSMGWNLGFLREFGGGAIDFGKAATKLAQMKQPEITNKMLFTSIYTAQAMLFGGLATWALTEKSPTQFLDYFYPKTGEKNDDGSDERLSTPYYTREYFMAVSHIQKDGLIGGTAGLIAGKSNPLLAPLIELFKNKDYFGYEIHDPHSPYIEQAEQVAAFLAKSAMPISVASGIESHASETAKVASYAGFNPAPRYITRTAIQNDISNLYERRYGGEEQKPYSKRLEYEAKQAIKEAKKAGDDEKVQELELEARHNKVLTTRQVSYMHRANIPADVFMWKRLPESDKQALRAKMSDEEKKRYPFKGE
jgi:hypothetical protein